MSEVKLTSNADLEAIHKALKKMMDEASVAMKQIEKLGTKTNDNLEKVSKKTENNIKKTGQVLKRLASSLLSDFKALVGLESVMAGLKLTHQFEGAVHESIKLGDSVRRLAGSFGIAKKDFNAFHAALARGLGDIGVSSEAAAEALAGLAGHGVTGQKSTVNMAKGATTLAGIGGQKGQEKEVASALAEAIEASGGDINNQGVQQKMIGEVTAAVQTTGKSATEILGVMRTLSEAMPKEMRKNVGPDSLAKLATIATSGGSGVLKAIEEYLKAGPGGRQAMEAQGFKPFDNKGGVDIHGIEKFIANTQKRGMDARQGLQTAGFSDEAAEGLVRLGEKAHHVHDSLEKLEGASRDNEKAFKESMGMVDAFKGSINTVKGRVEEFLAPVGEKITEVLSGAIGNKKAGLVVGGGAVLASKLVGGGLKTLSEKLLGHKLGGNFGEKAKEAIIGEEAEKVMKVHVENAAEIGEASGKHGGSVLEKITEKMTDKFKSLAEKLIGPDKLKTLGKVGAVAAAGAVGYEVGTQVINPALDKYTQGETEGIKGNVVERGFAKLDKYLDFTGNQKYNTPPVKVEVHTKEPGLKPVNKIKQPPSN